MAENGEPGAPGQPSVRRRALGGVLSLAGRDVALKLLAFGGWIALARLLDPATFGLFAVASFALSVFALFSQLGLGASVVRDRSEVDRPRLDALFTLQLAVVAGIALLTAAAAPLLALAANDAGLGWLVVALAAALVLLSLRSVPAAMQERDLAYGAPVLADIVTQVTFWTVAIGGAWAGWSIWSVVASVLASSALGTVVLLVRTRWRPALNFGWRAVKGEALFGLMYASQSLAHFAKYAMLPGLGGPLYGATALGYLTWAHQVAALPVQIAQPVSRVAYPALAHLQHVGDEFARLAADTLAWACRLTFPVFAVLIGLAPQVTEHIYGEQWIPAVGTLVLLSAAMAVGVPVNVLVPALYSLGRGRAGMALSLGWTALTWVAAGAFAAAGMGYDALAAGYVVGSAVALAAVLYALRDIGPARLLRAMALPTATGAAAGLAAYGASGLVDGLAGLLVVGGAIGVLALAANLWPERARGRALLGALRRG
ncbi:MAG TPA: oligosaccharide flippase family protein [Chloroflexia bacterium]|nr:oligosaccharide flippase family protein [Chloroflexia bacterium]